MFDQLSNTFIALESEKREFAAVCGYHVVRGFRDRFEAWRFIQSQDGPAPWRIVKLELSVTAVAHCPVKNGGRTLQAIKEVSR